MLDVVVCARVDVLVTVQTGPDGRKLFLGELPAVFYTTQGSVSGAECGEGSRNVVLPARITRAQVLQLSSISVRLEK